MPAYAFKCKCGHKAEAFFCINDDHTLPCGECGKNMKKDYREMIPAYHDVAVDSVDIDLLGPDKPVVYHTRGQLRKIAKQHGCSVDFTGRGIR